MRVLETRAKVSVIHDDRWKEQQERTISLHHCDQRVVHKKVQLSDVG